MYLSLLKVLLQSYKKGVGVLVGVSVRGSVYYFLLERG